jgi:PAS domain-containing protein
MIRHELERYHSEIDAYLASSNGIGIALVDADLVILGCNPGFMRLFNPNHNPNGQPLSDYLELNIDALRCGEELLLPTSRKLGMNAINYCHLIRTDSGFLLFCERRILTESRALEQMGGMNVELINIQREMVKKNYQLEKLTTELDLRVKELQETLDRVKRLEGIISICMYCKKIRSEEESWILLEKYISEHTDAEFSHGICPICLEEHYPA